MPLLVGLIGLLNVLVMPNFVSLKVGGDINEYINRELRCFENLLEITLDHKIAGRQCPLSDEPYSIKRKEDRETMTCPVPKNHKWIKTTTFIKRNNKWELMERTEKVEINEGSYSIEATFGKIDLTILPDKLTIKAESTTIMRYFVAPFFSSGFLWRLLIMVVISIVLLFKV